MSAFDFPPVTLLSIAGFSRMNTEERETQEISISLSRSVLKQIDRIVNEKGLSREQVINNILDDHFSSKDDWLDDLIQ